ncbi:MAG: hypothetical protein FWB86_04705 [Treponema sp.]|nr:hypothetical protein [Treponema sp.]MCL2250734.1 hypothetical protein [Treponema sp.]
MAGPLEATVVLGKCSKTKKLFGMRVEKRGKEWVRTWAFPLDESTAKNEGFAANKVSVGGADSEYPGCPHCKNGGFVLCGCDKVGCSGGIRKEGNLEIYTCPWCGNSGAVENVDVIDVKGGGY